MRSSRSDDPRILAALVMLGDDGVDMRGLKSGAPYSYTLLEIQRAAGEVTPLSIESTELLVWTEHRRDVDAHVGSLIVLGIPHERIRVSTTLEPTDRPDVYKLATRVEVMP